MIINIILAFSVLFSSVGIPNASLYLDKNLPTDFLQIINYENPGLLNVNTSEISSLAVKNSGIEPKFNGSATVAYDTENGQILFGYKENEAFPIASLTKIMTATIVLENIDNLSSVVTVSSDAALIEGSRMGIWIDEKITARDLLYGMLLKSGNDAAKALQEYYDNEVAPEKKAEEVKKLKAAKNGKKGRVAGEETDQIKSKTMVELMNEKAKVLGLTKMKFEDTSGISENNVATPKELAVLYDYALKNADFAYIMQIAQYTGNALNGGLTHPMTTTNRLLRTRDDVIAGKTGYSEAAGWNHSMVFASPSTDNHKIAVIALGTSGNDERFDECNKIIDYVYSAYKW